MIYNIISLFPEIIESYCSTSIIGRAVKNNLINVSTVNPREFATNNYKSVDDIPYGGGSGMVMMCDPIFRAVESIERQVNHRVILTSPRGVRYNQSLADELSKYDQLIIICGHYEGLDERISICMEPLEISLGDFILTGGELVAMSIIDSTARLLDGVLGKKASLESESFNDGLLEYPQYTRPYDYRGMKVPDVLLSGHHSNINNWRHQQSLKSTYLRRPDLLKNLTLTHADLEYINNLEMD